MKITYVGHSCFLLQTARHRLLIDPGEYCAPADAPPLAELACDFVLLSHGHDDHSGRALEVAQAHSATIVANFEIAEYFAARGAKVHGMNPGGAFAFPFGRVKFTIAHHTSSLNSGLNPVYMGVACGLVIEADGKRIYHAGDTGLFLDMQLIGRDGLDLAMLPIGDNFTMGPADAIEALDFLKPKACVPMHYNTWPPITQDAGAFARAAAARGHKVRPLLPGDSFEI
jgi:L-ascorbate metabolism protein UlaG (beta-lactamase superfamily)